MQEMRFVFLKYAELLHKTVKFAQNQSLKIGQKMKKNKTLYNLGKGVAV